MNLRFMGPGVWNFSTMVNLSGNDKKWRPGHLKFLVCLEKLLERRGICFGLASKMRNFIWRNIWFDESQFQLEYVTYCEHLLQKASSHGNWMSQKSFANRIENRPFWSRLPDVSADGMSRQLRCVRLQHCSILLAIRVLSIHFSSHWIAIFSDEKILMHWLFMQLNHRHH